MQKIGSGSFKNVINKMYWQIIYLIYMYKELVHGLVGRVFTNGPEDLGSIPGRVIPKTLKMVLDTSLLNSQ